MSKINLPEPECKNGYPRDQLKRILGDRFDKFCKYMNGQTVMICKGRNCGPHGVVMYKSDLITFLEGLSTLD